MEPVRPIMKWAKSAYVVYGIVFVTILGGLIQVLALADQINYGIVRLLEANPAGPELSGRFLFPKNWIVILTIFILMLLIFPCTVILRYFVDSEDDSGNQVIGLRGDVDDIVRFVENITGYIFSNDVDIRPFEFKSVDVRYKIMEDGDTFVEAEYVIRTTEEPGHFFRYWVNADPESDPVSRLRDLQFQVTDVGRGVTLDWLPTKHEDRNKMFAIFFPEMPPNSEKKLRISFYWPKFMRKLIKLGAASFNWSYVSKTSNLLALIRIEWDFSHRLGGISCRMIGPVSHTANLRFQNRTGNTIWIYENLEDLTNTGEHTVEFARDMYR